MTDENLRLRQTKRGQLMMANLGENTNGSEFMITLGTAANVFDGYNVLFGELVEGAEVLDKVEEAVTRLRTIKEVIKIEDCGTK